MPLPPKLLRRGITDILRISDARMSGTAYGAVVLHVSPEAAAGGPLALVRNGDLIEVDVPARRLHLDVSDAELAHAARQLEAGAGAHARLVQAVRGSRAAGASRRRSRRAGRRQRRRRVARLSLRAVRTKSSRATLLVATTPLDLRRPAPRAVSSELRRLAEHLVDARRHVAFGDQPPAPAGEHDAPASPARWP